MLHILLADDHQIVRSALRTMVQGLVLPDRLELCCLEACNFVEMHTLLGSGLDIDVAIVDVHMGHTMDPNGSTAATPSEPVCLQPLLQLVQTHQKTSFIVLSGFLRTEWTPQLKAAGIYASLSKSGSLGELRGIVLEAIHSRPDKLGQKLPKMQAEMPAETLAEVQAEKADPLPQQDISDMPQRLQEIHKLLCEGARNKLIARQLGLSEGTVKNYVSELYRRLKVTSRIEASRKPF